MSHTPTPWRHTDAGIVSGGRVICEAPIHYLESHKHWPENAEFITRACNNHDALLAALTDILGTFSGECYDWQPARAAIAAATGAQA